MCFYNRNLIHSKDPTAFSMIHYSSYVPQEALMVLVTPASAVASLQSGKWFVAGVVVGREQPRSLLGAGTAIKTQGELCLGHCLWGTGGA